VAGQILDVRAQLVQLTATDRQTERSQQLADAARQPGGDKTIDEIGVGDLTASTEGVRLKRHRYREFTASTRQPPGQQSAQLTPVTQQMQPTPVAAHGQHPEPVPQQQSPWMQPLVPGGQPPRVGA
jgi:hypothetical protein